MVSIREIRRKARTHLHEKAKVGAYYIADSNVPNRYVKCSVRVHTKFAALGAQIGTNFHSAEREDEIPKIIFWREEIATLTRGAIVSVEAGEAYRIDYVFPTDDQTITAQVTVVPLDETTNLPYPRA